MFSPKMWQSLPKQAQLLQSPSSSLIFISLTTGVVAEWSVTRPLLGLVASCGSYWQLGSPGQLWPSGPFRAMTQDHPLPNRRDISYQPCSALSCQRCRQLQPPVKLISPSQSRHKSEFNFCQDRKLTSGKCRVRQMLGNIEDLRDFHRRVMLPRMEEAVGDASLMRSRVLTKIQSWRLSYKWKQLF